MDRTKRSKAAVAGFPNDPLVEILSRVPAKPLFRFKCVSKAWCDLIAYRLRGKKFPQTLEGFFFGGGGGVNFGHFIDLSRRSVNLVDPAFSFLTKLPWIQHIVLLSSHNGLLLFGHIQDCGTYRYIVCNPATEQWVAVPSSGWSPSPAAKKCENDEESYVDDTFAKEARHFLIFDPAVSSHFHLVQFCHFRGPKVVEAVLIYSSEAGVWSNRTRAWMQYGKRWEGGADEIKSECCRAYVNGMLHVLAYSHYHHQTNKLQIVAVDMQKKPCRIIHWPEKNECAADAAFIGQSQGRLHCISAHQKLEGSFVHITGLSIWVLENYDTEQWVLKESVSCSQLLGEMGCRINDLEVAAIHPDCNLVFFVHDYDQKLISYDMDSKEVCAIRTLGHGCQSIVPYVPYFAESVTLTNKH